MKLKKKIENFIVDQFSSSSPIFMLLFSIGFTIITLFLSVGWLIGKIYNIIKWIAYIFASPFIYTLNRFVRVKWIVKVFDSIYFYKFLSILLRALLFVFANIISRHLLSHYWNEWWFNVVVSVLLVSYFYPEKEKEENEN